MSASEKNFMVYKASAGSGKTFKLVNEFLTLCLQSDSRFYFSKILAITFTNKAAGEMKERIMSHLKILSASPGEKHFDEKLVYAYVQSTGMGEQAISERAKNILEAILHNYTALGVSTIDKFTHKLIRSFARDLKLAADFNIETDTAAPLEKTIDEIISLAGQDEEITAVLEKYTQFLTDNGENWVINKGLTQFGKQLLEEDAIVHLDKLKSLSPEQFKILFQELSSNVKHIEEKWIHTAREFKKVYDDTRLSDNHFKGVGSGIHRHFKYAIQKDFLNKSFPFTEPDKTKLAHLDYFNKSLQASIPSNIQDKIHSLLVEFAEQIENLLPEYALFRLLQKNIYHLALIDQLNAKLAEVKQADNTLLIGEFNRIISDTIKNDPAPFIYERIGERYHHILIDEFQDTSQLQFINILPLLENSLSNSHRCLLVGDPKQAIYRWRNGDVDQFIQLPAIEHPVTPEIKNAISRNYTESELRTNRRSGKEIVAFNNRFFKASAELLRGKYRDIYSELNQEAVRENGYVELEVTDPDHPESSKLILECIDKKITDCIDNGFRLKDITILVRNNKDGSLIASYLHDKKIPVISKDSLLLQAAPEVQLIMNFILYLAKPFDTTASFKIIELNEFIKGNTDENTLLKYQSPYNRNKFDVLQYFEDHQIQFNRTRFLNATSYHLILESIQLFFPKNPSVYLRFLSEFVFNNWKNKPVDTLELCEWWNENKQKLSIRTAESENAIKIMTIHASKGLQFPVVIFPFADWKQKNGKEWLWLDFKNENLSVETALVKSNSSLLDSTPYNSVKSSEKDKSDLDDLNLLYVAFTRPEERLYIIGREKDTLKKYLPVFTQVMENQNGTVFTYGKPQTYASKSEQNTSVKKLDFTPGETWDKRLQLSLSRHKNSDEQEAEYLSKLSGILLHAIFEEATDLDQALYLLKNKIRNNPILVEQQSNLETEIKNTFTHPEVALLLKYENRLNECTIVDTNGQSYRPDKVLFDSEKLIILDFKTGTPKPSHNDQIRKYGELFSLMGYNSVKLYLFYTKDSRLIQI